MSSLHFDCFSGISGDMTLGALVDLGLPLRDLVRGLKALPLDGYRLKARKVRRGGLPATKVDVVIERSFRSSVRLKRIQELIRASRLPSWVADRSRVAFDLLGDAEGRAHGVPRAEVHFHEVGAVDSLVDVIGSLLGCHLLGLERFTASPVNVGSGLIASAHGTLPVPGPAVAALAGEVPIYSAGPRRELTTPTGMALLRTLVAEFGPLPLMRVEGVGSGAGTADTPDWPNLLRVFCGAPVGPGGAGGGTIVQIETNLDDLNPQAYESVMDRLFAAGAVDVMLTPVIMKHGRPGTVLTALAPREKAEAVAAAVLRETTTLGVRLTEVVRRILPRRVEVVRLEGWEVRIKIGVLDGGEEKASPEYRDCKRIAEQTGRPVRTVMEEALEAYRRRPPTAGRRTRAGTEGRGR